MHVWLLFALCAAVIMYSGSKLVHHGDVIAAKRPLQELVGSCAACRYYSLPELFTRFIGDDPRSP